MKQGLLWFDNDPKRKLADKIAQAVARHLKKFGYNPTVCYTNPNDLTGPVDIAGMQVEARKHILRYHFWVGVQ